MSADVAKIEPVKATTVAASNDGAVVLAMIDKLISRPDVPVEKLEQMFALHQKVQAEASRRSFMAAFALMQPELPIIAKRGTISTNEKTAQGTKTGNQIAMSKYALWEDICEGVMPILARHGFSLSFRIDQPTPDRVKVTGVLGHEAGHEESTSFALPIDNSGAKNNVQGWASSVSYGKRYTGMALLNIAARGEDDDGHAAGAKTSAVTVDDIKALIAESKTEATAILQHYSVETFDDLTGKQRDEVKAKLTAKLANMRRSNARG